MCRCHGSIMRSWMSGPPVGRSRPGCSSRSGSTFSEFAGPAAVVGSRVATRAGSSGRITSSSQLPTVPQSTVMARASGADPSPRRPRGRPVALVSRRGRPGVGAGVRDALGTSTVRRSQPEAAASKDAHLTAEGRRGKGGGVTPPLSLARQVATGCAPAPDLDAAPSPEHGTALPPAIEAGRQSGWTN